MGAIGLILILGSLLVTFFFTPLNIIGVIILLVIGFIVFAGSAEATGDDEAPFFVTGVVMTAILILCMIYGPDMPDNPSVWQQLIHGS